jgi:hypothetical protein
MQIQEEDGGAADEPHADVDQRLAQRYVECRIRLTLGRRLALRVPDERRNDEGRRTYRGDDQAAGQHQRSGGDVAHREQVLRDGLLAP